MQPSQLVWWALAIGVAWIIIGGLTGADEWVRSLFGANSKTRKLEKRIAELEKRLAELEKK